MMPTTYATVAVLTALAPLVAPQPQDDPEIRSFDVSGCQLYWDGGLYGNDGYFCTPYWDFEYFSGFRGGSGAEGEQSLLKSSAVTDLLVTASGLFEGKGRGDIAVSTSPNSSRFLLRAPGSQADVVARNLETIERAIAPDRRLVIEQWSAPAGSPGLGGGLVGSDGWAQLQQIDGLSRVERWETQLSPGRTTVMDDRTYQPLIVDYNVEIASQSFAMDEVSMSACDGAHMTARYGGGMGGGWLRVTFEIDRRGGEVQGNAFGGGGLINGEQDVQARQLSLTLESQDVQSRGFQLAGFLPAGGAYIVGLPGTEEGRLDWFSVRVEGRDVEGLHSLTSVDGETTTYLVESEGFSERDFGRLIVEDYGQIEMEGLMQTEMAQGTGDELLSALSLARASGRAMGPFTVAEVDGRSDGQLIEGLLAATAAKSRSFQALEVNGEGQAQVPLVPGASFRVWSLECDLRPTGFDVEVAQGTAVNDPTVRLRTRGFLIDGRPSRDGWSLTVSGSARLADGEPKTVQGWAKSVLHQDPVSRVYTRVQIRPETGSVTSVGTLPKVSLRVL